MKLLVIADEISPFIYNLSLNSERPEFLKNVDFVISCGDLPKSYLEYVATLLNVPCYYVPGNHDKDYAVSPPQGWISLDDTIVRHQSLNLMGLGGSPRYNDESPYQYTELQMKLRYWKLLPKIWLHRKKVDIFVSHAPAFGLGDLPGSLLHEGFKVFRKILDRWQPSFFFYGHVQLNYGVGPRRQTYGKTELINGYQHYIIEIPNS